MVVCVLFAYRLLLDLAGDGWRPGGCALQSDHVSFCLCAYLRWPKILWCSITFHAISRFVTHSHTIPLQPINHQSLHIGVSHTETHSNRKHPAGVRFHRNMLQTISRPSLSAALSYSVSHLQINNKGIFLISKFKKRNTARVFLDAILTLQ